MKIKYIWSSNLNQWYGTKIFLLTHVTDKLYERWRLGERSCLRDRVFCSVIRTILNVIRARKERLNAKDKIIVPTCLRRLSRETPVLHARYSALAAIIIFSLGIWCHKFDLVISFTGCTRAGNDGGGDAGAAEKKEKRAGTRHRKASAKIGNILSGWYPAVAKKRYLISSNICTTEYYLKQS